VLPRLVSFTPDFIPFRASFTLECVVEAILRPEIHWKIYKHASFVGEERFVRISTSTGSPFSEKTRYKNNKATSTLIVNHIGLCINDTEIACYASNNVQRSTRLHTFEARRGESYTAICVDENVFMYV